jgi:hypothetical protein
VPSHLIRLRKAWQCQSIESHGLEENRLDLPLTWPPDPAIPPRARLTRVFSTPPIEPALETLAIRFEQVPGLRSIRLNDRSIHLLNPLPDRFEIEADLIKGKNCLVLEVDFTSEKSTIIPPVGEGWGSIALVIRSRN